MTMSKYEIIFTIIDNKKLYWTGNEFSTNRWESKHYVNAKTAIKLINKSRKFRAEYGSKNIKDNGCFAKTISITTPPLFREVIKAGCNQLIIPF